MRFESALDVTVVTYPTWNSDLVLNLEYRNHRPLGILHMNLVIRERNKQGGQVNYLHNQESY